MKNIALILILAAGAGTAGDRPRVSAALISQAAQRLDFQLSSLTPADDPVQPIGLTQGTYIAGFGVIFMGSVNLAPMAGITPFHPSISKQEYARVHQKKMDRLPKLKQIMEDMLLAMSASMDTVAPDDQIAIAISLFSFAGEDTAGMPAQIVMHAPKKSLLDAQMRRTPRESLATLIQTDLF